LFYNLFFVWSDVAAVFLYREELRQRRIRELLDIIFSSSRLLSHAYEEIEEELRHRGEKDKGFVELSSMLDSRKKQDKDRLRSEELSHKFEEMDLVIRELVGRKYRG